MLRFSYLLLLVCLCSTAFADVDSNLIAYWRFDDNDVNYYYHSEVNDIADWYLTTGAYATNTQITGGKVGARWAYDGHNANKRIDSNSILNTNLTSEVTIGGWFKFSNANTGSTKYIVSLQNGFDYSNLFFNQYSNSQLMAYINSQFGNVVYDPGYNMNDDAWRFFVMTYDRYAADGNRAKVYMNSQKTKGWTAADEDFGNSDYYLSANRLGSASAWFCIDDMFLYDRALSQADINELWNDGNGYDPTWTEPEADIWKLWADAGENGTIVTPAAETNQPEGNNVSIEADANTCYVFTSWQGQIQIDDVNFAVDNNYIADINDATTTLIMPDANYWVIASFGLQSLTWEIYIKLNAEQQLWLGATYVAQGCPGYSIHYLPGTWSGTGVDLGYVQDINANPVSFTPQSDCNLILTLSGVGDGNCILVTDVNGNGSIIEPNVSIYAVACDTNVVIAAEGNQCSACFASWSGAGAGKVADVNSAGTTILLDDNNHITANFLACEISADGNYWAKSINAEEALTIEASTHLNIGTNDFSVCGWIYLGGDFDSEGYIFRLEGESQSFKLYGYTGDSQAHARLNDTTEVVSELSGNGIVDGDEHFIAVTCDRDSNQGFKLYVDGVLCDTGDATVLVSEDYNFTSAWVNYYVTAYGSTFVYSDQPRFYNKALSLAEIGVIYNNGRGIDVNEANEPNLVWYSELNAFDINCVGGRYYNGAEWTNSNLLLYGGEMVAGGVPFDVSRDLSAYFRRLME